MHSRGSAVRETTGDAARVLAIAVACNGIDYLMSFLMLADGLHKSKDLFATTESVEGE